MEKKPKIIMKETEEIIPTKHFLEDFDCVLIYEKTDNEDEPVLTVVAELMLDMSYNDKETYILINDINDVARGIYPCSYCLEFWEDFIKDYFPNPNEYYYVYKREGDYTVNEEYHFE